MSQSPGIDDDPRNSLLPGSVNALYQSSLVVALKSLKGGTLAFRNATELLVDARKGLLSVDPRLTSTQHIEIGAVNEQDPSCRPGTRGRCPLWLGHRGSLGLIAEIVQCSAQFDYE